MLGRLILLFTVVPLLELALLIWMGSHVGVVPTIALVLTTGVLGAALARHQGLATWGRFHAALGAGRLPEKELIEGLLILVAGALLITPGLLTDMTGFLLLIPPLRHRLARWTGSAVRRRVVVAGPGRPPRRPAGSPGARPTSPPGTGGSDDTVIDAEFEVVERDDPDR